MLGLTRQPWGGNRIDVLFWKMYNNNILYGLNLFLEIENFSIEDPCLSWYREDSWNKKSSDHVKEFLCQILTFFEEVLATKLEHSKVLLNLRKEK